MSEFIEIQEIKAKLQNNLGDPDWRRSATQYELEFYELALDQLSKSPPNEIAAARFEEIRAAAELMNPEFADIIIELQKKGHNIDQTLFHVLKDRLKATEGEVFNLASTNPALEICKKIVPKLRNLLNWETNGIHWNSLSITIQLLSNFYHHICITDKKEDTSFLFAEKIGGLGANAKESNLEKYFISKMEGMCTVERQLKNETPGRSDLFFRWVHGVNFPIEVKVENKDISPQNIKQSYLAQPHLYATTTSQVSFLFVLDVILKNQPGKFEADYWYIDSLDNLDTDYPIYVIVVIFPANRFRPSDYSWGKA
jgi:hypothetical protein